jgi:hypothetical protein
MTPGDALMNFINSYMSAGNILSDELHQKTDFHQHQNTSRDIDLAEPGLDRPDTAIVWQLRS